MNKNLVREVSEAAAMSGYGWDGITRIRARVRLRPTNPHTGAAVKPEAEVLEGEVLDFHYAWHMDEGDNYPGEVAWVPEDIEDFRRRFPIAPGWIASGDLEIISENK